MLLCGGLSPLAWLLSVYTTLSSPPSKESALPSIEELNRDIVACKKCPRLVEYLAQVARTKRRMYLSWDYWAKPIPSFGDPDARLMVLGLAPAAHGGNRTGRSFTGDRSGDWVYGTLHKFGFANQPTSTDRDDGLALQDALISAAARCAPPANKPLPQELENCRPYLLRELELLQRLRVVIALGKIAFDSYLAAVREMAQGLPVPRPRFGHEVVFEMPGGITLLGSYHPSQQNTQTGRLTRDMFESVFRRARSILDGD